MLVKHAFHLYRHYRHGKRLGGGLKGLICMALRVIGCFYIRFFVRQEWQEVGAVDLSIPRSTGIWDRAIPGPITRALSIPVRGIEGPKTGIGSLLRTLISGFKVDPRSGKTFCGIWVVATHTSDTYTTILKIACMLLYNSYRVLTNGRFKCSDDCSRSRH